VTGASGFVARALFASARIEGTYVAVSRSDAGLKGVEWRPSPGLSATADWQPVLEGVDSVVHLAGRVHLAAGGDPSPYFAENCDATFKLARDAISAGVKRFVFLSSAKVLGDESDAIPLADDAPTRPGDPYAASKLAAEQALRGLGGEMGVTILRPPLVYGPGVKANFLALLTAVARGWPLPLSAIHNRRSLIGVENLAAAIAACASSDAAAGRTYNVTDGAPVSTPALVRAMAAALGRPARLFPVAPGLLEAGGKLLGRGEMVKRLTRSLEIDDVAIRAELGWRPVCSFETGIAKTARWYQSRPNAGF
jgi:nucleoside-diphosphate-sugar epimerase